MPRRRHRPKRFPRRPAKRPPRATSAFILLDRFSVGDIRRWAAYRDKILRFHWDYYSNLAFQRSKVADRLSAALHEAAEGPFAFDKWQRAVKYRYALEPLSVDGSLVDPGGRFNIGDIDPVRFRPFPALYVAADKDTALQEALSQKIEPDQEQKALDFALANPTSIANVSMTGSLEKVIDLRSPERMEGFVDLIKGFEAPDHLVKAAKEIGLPPPELIRSVQRLMDSILDPNWRSWPMQFDVPVASQIFGQLVADAGMEGIVYPSKFNKKDCLAVFPQNFKDSESFVQLDDEPPPEVKIRRLDARTWGEIRGE